MSSVSWRQETSALDTDGRYPDYTGLEWYPPKHQNHVSFIPCWYVNVVSLRRFAIDRIDFAFRFLRDLHCVYSAVHDSADLGNHIAACSFQPWGMLEFVCWMVFLKVRLGGEKGEARPVSTDIFRMYRQRSFVRRKAGSPP